MSKYGFFSGPHFPAFGRNTVRYGVSLRIQSKKGKCGPEKTPYLRTSHSDAVNIDSNVASVHWRFKIIFQNELKYHFCSNTRGSRILRNSMVIVTITSNMFTLLPAVLLYHVNYLIMVCVCMWHVVTKNKYGKGVYQVNLSNVSFFE